MSGKVCCDMLVLEKDEDPKDKEHSVVYIGSWLYEGDIYLDIMDENDKSVIVSMAPELLVALIQKAYRENAMDIQKCLECGDTETAIGEANTKLPITLKNIKGSDPKIAIV